MATLFPCLGFEYKPIKLNLHLSIVMVGGLPRPKYRMLHSLTPNYYCRVIRSLLLYYSLVCRIQDYSMDILCVIRRSCTLI